PVSKRTQTNLKKQIRDISHRSYELRREPAAENFQLCCKLLELYTIPRTSNSGFILWKCDWDVDHSRRESLRKCWMRIVSYPIDENRQRNDRRMECENG